MFRPDEIIFACTTECNLHCKHCFVKRNESKLSVGDAISFMKNCGDRIQRIGFSGGEPFLALDFVNAVIVQAIEQGYLFDRLMTNGVFWENEDDLSLKLQSVYDSGFDGKICLSYDTFHGQAKEKILKFINTVHEIWNDTTCLEIQSVISENDEEFLSDLSFIAENLSCTVENEIDKLTGRGIIILQNADIYIPVFRSSQTFSSDSSKMWQSKTWFSQDLCHDIGDIFYVHADGNIAPCCGFANENPRIFIGTVKDSYETIMQNAKDNPVVKLAYENGFCSKLNDMQKNGHLFQGKTDDVCSFCDYLCKQDLF